MARIVVIGDGPAGLSAALFLAKAGHDTQVWGDDQSLVEYAQLHNWLGSPDRSGTAFMDAAREHATAHGARLHEGRVAEVAVAADEVTATTAGGNEVVADWLVVAGGKASQALLADLGAAMEDGAVAVDDNCRTSIDRVYAAGHLVRPDRSQAIISAGAGAIAALDILSREAGTDVHDWDSPDEG